ncbi:hypothetical protein GDO78_020267 [Eleutherodactylus coqui]|uniref:Uncharacterized protein n=1 Tax=Eleutherodactylus coqui TaxID=57060 RepID=A0A8J6JTX7_ELECQ|nr:hypothetical protein GDO78_020267 [Eleutherodactylus coqui]
MRNRFLRDPQRGGTRYIKEAGSFIKALNSYYQQITPDDTTMASYLPIALLIILQVTGGLCQCPSNRIVPCAWQIAVIVLLSIVLFFILTSFCILIACGNKMKCSQTQCSSDVYLQNLGCRSQQQ